MRFSVSGIVIAERLDSANMRIHLLVEEPSKDGSAPKKLPIIFRRDVWPAFPRDETGRPKRIVGSSVLVRGTIGVYNERVSLEGKRLLLIQIPTISGEPEKIRDDKSHWKEISNGLPF